MQSSPSTDFYLGPHIANRPGTPDTTDSGISSNSDRTYTPSSFPGTQCVPPPFPSQPAIIIQDNAHHPNVRTRQPGWVLLNHKWHDCTIVAWSPDDCAYLVYVPLIEFLVSVNGTQNLFVPIRTSGPMENGSVAVDIWPYSVTSNDLSLEPPKLPAPIPFYPSQIQYASALGKIAAQFQQTTWRNVRGRRINLVSTRAYAERLCREPPTVANDFTVRVSYEGVISDIAFMDWVDEGDVREGPGIELVSCNTASQSESKSSHHPSPSHPSPLPHASPMTSKLRRAVTSFFRAALCFL